MDSHLVKQKSVYETLKSAIMNGQYQYGHRFASEPEFARELGVGRITLRAALKLLEQAGLIVRIQGKGTFVAADCHSKQRRLLVISHCYGVESPSNYLLPCIAAAALELDVRIDICAWPFFTSLSRQQAADALSREKYTAIILLANNFNGDENHLSILQNCGLPVILAHGGVNDYRICRTVAVIRPDYRTAFLDGIKHFIGNGHRRIALCGGNAWGISREEFAALLRDNNCEFQAGYYNPCPYDQAEIHQCVKRLLAMSLPPTAISCFSDFFAIQVYAALNNAGFRIPRDVAVMGLANFPGAGLLSPPLSSIDLAHAQAGRIAVEVSVRANDWFDLPEVSPPEIIIPHRIIERESTAIRQVAHLFAQS